MSKTHFGEPLNWHPFTVSKSSRIDELFQIGEDFQDGEDFQEGEGFQDGEDFQDKTMTNFVSPEKAHLASGRCSEMCGARIGVRRCVPSDVAAGVDRSNEPPILRF